MDDTTFSPGQFKFYHKRYSAMCVCGDQIQYQVKAILRFIYTFTCKIDVKPTFLQLNSIFLIMINDDHNGYGSLPL